MADCSSPRARTHDPDTRRHDACPPDALHLTRPHPFRYGRAIHSSPRRSSKIRPLSRYELRHCGRVRASWKVSPKAPCSAQSAGPPTRREFLSTAEAVVRHSFILLVMTRISSRTSRHFSCSILPASSVKSKALGARHASRPELCYLSVAAT
jgi:hypothetical protein